MGGGAARTEADARVDRGGHCPSCAHKREARRGAYPLSGVQQGGARVPPYCATLRACPLQPPVAHPCREGGVSTTPRVVPRAPPFACHPAHAAPHAGRRARGTRKVGRAGPRTRDERGVVRTRSAVLPSGSARPHRTGMEGGGRARGAFPRRPRLPPHAKGGRGAPRAVCVPVPILAAPPIAPVRAPLLVHARMGGPPSLHLIRVGRGAKGGARRRLSWRPTPAPS